MKVNELMIGNYVKCVGCKENIFQVISLFDGDLVTIQNSDDAFDCMLDRVKPIPITIDWLVKNGFKKEYEELCYSKEIDGYYIDITFGLSNKSEDHVVCHVDSNDRQTVGCADILYIHQLQNLLNILNIKEEFVI